MNVAVAPHVTQAAEGLPRRAFTVKDVERMVEVGLLLEDERVELIGGELVPMSPKGNQHEILKLALLRHWYRTGREDLDVMPETTFRLSADTYLEPDFVIFPRAVGIPGLGGENVLLVVEVADSSIGYDLGRKPAIYASFGIRELWVIDAVRRQIHVHREPQAVPGGANSYGHVEVFDAAALVVPAFAPAEFAIRLTELEAA